MMKSERTARFDMFKPGPVHTVSAIEPYEEPTLAAGARRGSNGSFIRSASFTTLVGLTKSSNQEGIKRTFSDNVLSSPAQNPTKISTSMQNANVELFRRASRKTKKRMSVGIRKETGGTGSIDESLKNMTDGEEQSRSTSQSVGGTIRGFARKTWNPLTRTDSPSRKNDSVHQSRRSQSPKKQANYTTIPIAVPEPVALRASPPLPDRKNGRKSGRNSESISSGSKPSSLKDIHSRNQSRTSLNRLSRQSSKTSLTSGGSTDGMFLAVPPPDVPPVPASASSDRLSGVSIEVNRRRDPLWTAFRSIEGEWSNFQSKTSLQKAKVIRGVLLPFLSRHADDPSNKSLRAEDLDHRVVILNKWWSGLLDLLNGRSNQSISGTDRPAFLEAIIEIMLRPEWRTPSFRSQPNASTWTNSIESDESDFLLETIHQNVRNIFVQNMLSQMALVVDKLSMRSAPASLVTFGGKTCAHAFFFCPGVADILLRLWHVPPGAIRRIFSEYGALYQSDFGQDCGEISQFFPPPVRNLCFSSQSAIVRHIQPRAQRPAGSDSIRWYGPWVNRWIGRDSDLFFVFTKHYHVLLHEFHPNTLSQPDLLCLPGLAAVHAQLLIVLESTLYRHVGHFTTEAYTTGDTADALVPLPMSIPNATRSMSENRLVILLRDIISDPDLAYTNTCTILIESFQMIMKTATRKVSMYNNEAVFVLCDLFDEVFPVLVQYERLRIQDKVLDWEFWVKVLQQMIQSETCMTQIRVIALLYNIWPIMMLSEGRRSDIILGWLLEPGFFNQFFNHWSPMVRHYYFRLLCWRVARCDGEYTESELDIYSTLALRLCTAWAHHQYLVAEADMRAMSAPSSNPCSPAPGRTLVIIRTDQQPTSPSTFTSFEKLLSRDFNSPYASPVNGINPASEADLPAGVARKKWSIFRNISLFGSSPSNGRPGEVTPPSSPGRGTEKRGANSGTSSAAPSRPATPPHQALLFKFSLEHMNNRPQIPNKSKRLLPPTLPTNAQRALNKLSAPHKQSTDSIVYPDIQPLKPQPHELNGARYSGRALAEWAQVVSECRNFYTRRKQEGCPKDSLIETPMMQVEAFRIFG